MKTLKHLTLIVIIFIFGGINAQVTTEWVARYIGMGNGNDYSTDMATDALGNVYVTGFITGEFNYDIATIKYNSSGGVEWTQTYNGPGNGSDYASDIICDASGNVYVTGYGTGSGTGNDYITLKYNAAGTLQWAESYNYSGIGHDHSNAIVTDDSGNVYVTGNSQGGTGDDYATIKYNSTGAIQWVVRYNSSSDRSDKAESITIDTLGNIYVTGSSHSLLFGNDYATIKYNSSGVMQWLAKYNGPGNGDDFSNSIVVDVSGNIFVSGRSTGSTTGFDYATIKYNSSGVQQWASRYSGHGNNFDMPNCLSVDLSGNVYVTGQSLGFGTNDDYATVKYNASGVELWVARYNGPGNFIDEAKSLALDASGNVYVTGNSRGSASDDYATIKYNSLGVMQWIERYNGPANDYDFANSIITDPSGNVYITGYSIGNGSSSDYTTIKYSQITPCSINLSAFIEGFYNSNTNTMASDTVVVYLRNTFPPYTKVDSTKGILNSFGNGNFYFSHSMNGTNYYIEIKHRNSIVTWSSSGNAFSSGSMTYNFSTSANKAFGNNQIQVDNSPIRFAIYSGDVNQDGIIDAGDLSLVDNDAFNSVSGYVLTDVNGDNFVDASDLSIVDNNATNGVMVERP